MRRRLRLSDAGRNAIFPAVLHCLDHCVVAVRDLTAATALYAELLGRPPSWRGRHPGAGTANSLFRLENVYLELLARDGEGPVGRRLAAALDERGEGLVALAFGTASAAACAEALRRRGIAVAGPREGEGRRGEFAAGAAAEPAVRRWSHVVLPTDVTRGVLLFAIEHRTPAEALPFREAAGSADAAIHAVDHVVVVSGDLDASRAIYRDTLGLRLALDRAFEARKLRILFFRVGDVSVEVVGSLDAPAEAAAADRFGGIAYRTSDVSAARSRLVAAGFDVSPTRDGYKPGTRVCTLRGGACGVPTLLIQPRESTTPFGSAGAVSG